MGFKFSTGIVVVALMAAAASAQAGEVRGVVEIFTSQGCSSCPPADRAYSTVTNQGGILGLAWHVDYWDRLGWPDTFSLHQATVRQENYGKGNFTPEVIVNGRTVVSESTSASAIAASVGGALPVRVSLSGQSVKIGAGQGNASIILVKFRGDATVAIGRGENAGRSVTYHHPVIGARQIGSWNGSATAIDLKPGECRAGGCAVLLQVGTGPILGAAVL